ncbi:MAG: acyltransferase [Rhodobacteraceae bacterium]|nr:acyltransferase [Paracoccaceae bacterium]
MTSSTRLTWIDSLRLLAGLSMVGLHATSDPMGQPWPDYDVVDRIGPVVIRAFLYVARTELFIIISVFLLVLALDRRPRSYGDVFKEQCRRLLIPFAFWTVFYAAYNMIKASAFGYQDLWISQMSHVTDWIGFALLGDVKYHMHFIPTLFGVIVFFPLYRAAVDHPWLGLGAAVGLVFKLQIEGFLYPTFWGEDTLPFLIRGAKILSYVGYGLFAGAAYGIWKRHGSSTVQNLVPVVVFAGALLMLLKAISSYKTIISGTYPFTYQPGYWADFLMPVVLFFLCLCLGHKTWPQILTKLAAYSFGIYLCHPIFLDLAEIALRETALLPTYQVLIKIGTVVPATALFVLLLNRLAPLAWTIGLGPLPKLFPRSPLPKESKKHVV